MEFIVYYIYDDKEATIHARSAKDAAIKFLMKYPRDDDSQIRVEVKKSLTQDNDSFFNTLDLLPEVEIYKNNPIQTILGMNISEDFIIPIFEEVIDRHPDWLKYSNLDEEDHTVDIIIPCPINEDFPIRIRFCGGESLVFVEFGPLYYDAYYLRHISGASSEEIWGDENHVPVADAIDEFVRRITSEEFIAARWKTRFGSEINLIDIEEYKRLKEKDKIIGSTSWMGTYNFEKETDQ
jgi:hypothetical protein